MDEDTFNTLTSDGSPAFAPTDHRMVWKALEECVEEGIIKAIGVSNFNSKQVERIIQNGRVWHMLHLVVTF